MRVVGAFVIAFERGFVIIALTNSDALCHTLSDAFRCRLQTPSFASMLLRPRAANFVVSCFSGLGIVSALAVSYTHLTLPTKA